MNRSIRLTIAIISLGIIISYSNRNLSDLMFPTSSSEVSEVNVFGMLKLFIRGLYNFIVIIIGAFPKRKYINNLVKFIQRKFPSFIRPFSFYTCYDCYVFNV